MPLSNIKKSILCAVLFTLTSAQAVPLSIQTPYQTHHFDVEVADTPEKSARGLMFRTDLAENNGMIFIHPTDQIWDMWMKNTYIPLDMIFFDRYGRIHKIHHWAKPFDLTPISSDIPLAGVLEIKGGLSQKLNINPNDMLIFHQPEITN